jgi:outer membrane cobalamin receptor
MSASFHTRRLPLLVAAATAAAAAAAALLSACHGIHPASAVPHNDSDHIFITQQMIERSGGQNAWEVLRREAPQLGYGENRAGQPAGMQIRGRSSILLNDSPMLIVDGVRTPDISTLQQLPASTLLSIEVLTGQEGTTYYGTDAAGGVILIKTKTGASR